MFRTHLLPLLFLLNGCLGGTLQLSNSDPTLRCNPKGAGTFWLEEGQSLQTTFSCGTGLDIPGSDFVIESLPVGAVYDTTTSTLTWTPDLTQASVYNLNLSVPNLKEVAPLKIGIADKFDDPNNTPVLDPSQYTEEFGLPVLHLETDPNLNSNDYTPAHVIYRGHNYTAESKLRGASSLGYPKKSFTLKFEKEDKFNEPFAVAGGFLEKRKVTLTTTFDDNSGVRQRLAFTLWNLLDPNHLQIQNYSAVVYVDGQFRGLYAITDHVDGFLMEDHGLNQDGNLYKAVNHDGNFRLTSVQNGGLKSTPHQGYEKKEGVVPNDFSDLDALVTFVENASDNDFRNQIGDLIHLKDFQDWWIFVSLIEGDDSAGKNSYLYHDPSTNQPWRYAPWDFNDSFGQTWQSARKGFDFDPEMYTWANNIFERLLADPTLGAELRARFSQALQEQYKLDLVLQIFDAMTTEIRPVVLRDERRWGEQYTTYGGWSFRNDFLTAEQETAYLRQWIIDRWTFTAAFY
jgi:spore coat protein H